MLGSAEPDGDFLTASDVSFNLGADVLRDRRTTETPNTDEPPDDVSGRDDSPLVERW
jgi:hypothetical protein